MVSKDSTKANTCIHFLVAFQWLPPRGAGRFVTVSWCSVLLHPSWSVSETNVHVQLLRVVSIYSFTYLLTYLLISNIGQVIRKPAFGVMRPREFQNSLPGWSLEILRILTIDIILSREPKTKTLIRCAVWSSSLLFTYGMWSGPLAGTASSVGCASAWCTDGRGSILGSGETLFRRDFGHEILSTALK